VTHQYDGRDIKPLILSVKPNLLRANNYMYMYSVWWRLFHKCWEVSFRKQRSPHASLLSYCLRATILFDYCFEQFE